MDRPMIGLLLKELTFLLFVNTVTHLNGKGSAGQVFEVHSEIR